MARIILFCGVLQLRRRRERFQRPPPPPFLSLSDCTRDGYSRKERGGKTLETSSDHFLAFLGLDRGGGRKEEGKGLSFIFIASGRYWIASLHQRREERGREGKKKLLGNFWMWWPNGPHTETEKERERRTFKKRLLLFPKKALQFFSWRSDFYAPSPMKRKERRKEGGEWIRLLAAVAKSCHYSYCWSLLEFSCQTIIFPSILIATLFSRPTTPYCITTNVLH